MELIGWLDCLVCLLLFWGLLFGVWLVVYLDALRLLCLLCRGLLYVWGFVVCNRRGASFGADFGFADWFGCWLVWVCMYV